MCWHFKPIFCTCLVLLDLLKLCQKSQESAWMQAYIWATFCIFVILYTKKEFWGSKKNSLHVFSSFWPFWPSKWLNLKLAHFLRPFLRTWSHDGSAHTYGSNHQFLEVPQKGVYKNDFLAFFLPKWGDLIGSTKTHLKILNLAWWSIGTNYFL